MIKKQPPKIRANLNLEMFSIFFELILAGLFLFCIGGLIYFNVNEISKAEFIKLCEEFTPAIITDLVPERQERITFIALSLMSPLICAAIICITRKLRMKDICKLPEQRISGLAIAVSIIALMFIVVFFGCQPQFVHILFEPVWGSYILLLLCLTLFFMMIYGLLKLDLSSINRWFIYFILFAIPLIQIFCCRLYTLDRIEMQQEAFHINIIAYPLSQSVVGASDYHQYGFYARMLAPIFKYVHPTVFNISAIMGILFFIGCRAVYRVMLQSVKNKNLILGFAVIFFLTSGSAVFLHCSTDFRIDPYFAYYPVRFLFPALAMIMFFQLSRFHKSSMAVWCGIIAGTGLFWCLDSGIPVVGALAATMLFQAVFPKGRRLIARNSLLLCISSVVSVIILLVLFSIQQGEIISLREMFKYINIFSASGFMMLPMPQFPAPWCFVIVIYLLALLIGLREFIAGRFEPWAKMSIFIAVLGIGLFTYYQGRSHINNLSTVAWPSLMLLFIYTDRLIRLVNLKFINRWFLILVAPALFFSACAVTTVVGDSKMIAASIVRTFSGIAKMNQSNPMEANVRFILKNAGTHKVVNILSDMQGVYYAETGLRAGINNFCIVETFMKKDRDRIAGELFKAKCPLFISIPAGAFSMIPQWAHQLYNMEAVSEDKTLVYFTPKQTPR